MKEHAEMIANLDPYGPRSIADMDTGYGGSSLLYSQTFNMTDLPLSGPIMIANSVKSYMLELPVSISKIRSLTSAAAIYKAGG